MVRKNNVISFYALRLLLAVIALLWIGNAALAQSVMDGFAPSINGSVNAVAVQSDGKIVVGGLFTSVNGQTRSNLARLNVDGSLDTTFNLGTDGTVFALCIQTGRIVVGGSFTTLGGQARANLGRLNADGTIDATFNQSANAQVYALKVQADYQVLIGGNFTMLGGQAHTRLGRISNTGALDAAFNPSFSGPVRAIGLQSDGRIVIGGLFSTVNNQSQVSLARLNADGTLDAIFTPHFDNSVNALAVQPDGKILVGGDFTLLNNVTRNRMARLNADGTLDPGFNADANGYVAAIVQRPDGRIYIGGAFTAVGNTAVNRIAPLNTDGTLGSPLLGGANNTVNALAIQTDGKLIAGGQFITIGGSITRNRLARYNSDNTVDADFIVQASGAVYAAALQPDGKLLVGGGFSQLGGAPVANLARLNQNGSFDVAFAGSTDGAVAGLVVQPDGKILVGGYFNTVDGQPHTGIARLNANGSVDNSFTLQVSGGTGGLLINTVNVIALQPDGKILIGGNFTYVGGQLHPYLARFNANGSLDSGFAPYTDDFVSSMAVQSDGKILLGGVFSMVNNQPRAHIARLNNDGTLDTGFNPGADSSVTALAVQPDGKVLAGGLFGTLGGQPRSLLGRLNANGSLDAGFNPGAIGSTVWNFSLQTDGKILVGGSFSNVGGQARSNLARLNLNGSIDTGFNPGTNDVVGGTLVLPDGKILVFGSFTILDGQIRIGLGRLTNTGAANQYLALINNTTLTWGRSGTSPEITRATFESSTDGVNYFLIGAGTRGVLSTWTFNNVSLPTNQTIYIRARGYCAGGFENSSGSIVELVSQMYIPSAIPCTFALNPSSQNFTSAGGSGSVALTASDTSCNWIVQSNAAWITPAVFSGTGSANIGYVVAPNNGLIQRTGTLTIAGQTFTVTQTAAGICVYGVTPQTLNVGAGGGAQFATVTTSAGCGWVAFPNVGWLTVTTPSGNGSGTAGFSVASNAGGQRTGTLTIAGQTVTVIQSAISCPALTLSPAALPNAQLNAAYSQAITVTPSSPPFNFTVVNGVLPNGLQLAANGQLAGVPTQSGTFNFTVAVTDANGCSGSKGFTLTVDPGAVSATNLQFYPLAHPVRLLDTRVGFTGCDSPAAKIAGGTSRTQTAAGRTCDGLTIPANAAALVGNATSVQSGGGYFTLYPSDIAKPNSANSNYSANQILNSLFTVRLGANDGAFKIFTSTDTDIVVDITGYYAPPSATGLYFH
ncbi:MAG: putative Ig domain-containing protein, partial [Acidobacteria bacterium]|nr:putative Ig domain-containing protein [Acidobacteriota bacterium]